jgi:hypothetical protein
VAAADDRTAGTPPGASQGPAVDRTGQPVVDPTQNVLDLVEAAIRRQDDLRQADSAHLRELMAVRSEYDQKLRDSDRHEAGVRAGYEDRLAAKETARLDAIRAVDVANVESARQVAEARANTLATQQQASADALRNQVEQARITTADALAQTVAPLQKSIEDLRQAQYQQQGEKSSKVETSTADRDTLALETARIQAAAQRTQVYGLIVAVIVLALGIYAAFHK